MTIKQVAEAVMEEAFKVGLSPESTKRIRAIKSILNTIDDMENRLMGLRKDVGNEIGELIKSTNKSKREIEVGGSSNLYDTVDNVITTQRLSSEALKMLEEHHAHLNMLEKSSQLQFVQEHITLARQILDDNDRFIKERDKLNFIMKAADEAFKESQKKNEVSIIITQADKDLVKSLGVTSNSTWGKYIPRIDEKSL